MFTIVKGCSNSLQKGLIKNSGAIARLVLLSCDGGQLSNFVSCVAYKCCFSRHILKCQINKLLEMLLLQVKNWRLSSEAIKRSKEQLLGLLPLLLPTKKQPKHILWTPHPYS